MSFDRGVLAFLGAFVLLAGLACLAAPASFAQQAGWSATPAGLTEIRAFYGGLQVGLGCFLIWCSRHLALILPGLFVEGFVVGGIGIARSLGMIVDRAPSTFHLTNLAVEGVTVALVVVAISKRRAVQPDWSVVPK